MTPFEKKMYQFSLGTVRMAYNAYRRTHPKKPAWGKVPRIKREIAALTFMVVYEPIVRKYTRNLGRKVTP